MKRLITLITLLVPIALNAASGTRTGRLTNGMDITLVENHSVPMIAANIIVKAGARDESWQTWGAAHFLEHLLFNGTATRTQDEIYAAFDRIGAYHNAHTGSHFTDFMVLTDSEHFTTGFDILADMVFSSVLPPEKVEKERGIVIEEIARTNTSDDGIDRMFAEILYGRSPLSREVLGTTESISRLDRDSVMAFYKRWYQPNNAMLFVTGDFKADTLFDWLNTRLAQYPPVELPTRRIISKPNFGTLAANGIFNREAVTRQNQAMIAWEAPMPDDPDFVPFMLLLKALDKRFEAGLPSGVNGGTGLELDPDVSVATISFSAATETKSSVQLLALIDLELNRLIKSPISPKEIERLSRGYLAEQIYNSERLHYYGMMYSSYWALVSFDEFISWNYRFAKVTPEQLKAVAKRWLMTDKRLEVAVSPRLEETADSSSAENQMARRSGAGIPTVIVRSDPSARVFAVHVLAKDRWLWDRQFQTGTVDLLHRSLERLATSGQEIGDHLEALSATIKTADSPGIPYDDYYTAPEYSFIRFELLPDHWREGVEVLAELVTKAPLTEQIVDAAKEGVTAGKAASGRNPAGIGIGKFRENCVGNSSFAASVYGDVSGVTLADVIKLRQNYLHPENLIVTVSGPIPADEAADAIAKAFRASGNAKSEQPADFIKAERTLRSVSLRDTVSLGKPQGAVVMGKVLKSIPQEDRAALTIANAWFSDRMGMELREKRGLAYSLGSGVSFQRDSNGSLWGLWEISIGTRPERLAESESGILELLEELRTHQFTEDELEKLRSAIAGRLMMRDMARIGQAYAMGVGEFFWNDPDSRTHLIEGFKALTPDAVQAAAAKYLTPDGLSTIIVK